MGAKCSEKPEHKTPFLKKYLVSWGHWVDLSGSVAVKTRLYVLLACRSFFGWKIPLWEGSDWTKTVKWRQLKMITHSLTVKETAEMDGDSKSSPELSIVSRVSCDLPRFPHSESVLPTSQMLVDKLHSRVSRLLHFCCRDVRRQTMSGRLWCQIKVVLKPDLFFNWTDRHKRREWGWDRERVYGHKYQTRVR